MLNTKFHSIDSLGSRWQLIIITILFGFIYTNIFKPFGVYNNHIKLESDTFTTLSMVFGVALIVLIFTQFVVLKLFRIKVFTYATLILWFFFESFIIGTICAILCYLFNDMNESIITCWYQSIIAVISLIILPYFIALFYISYKEKEKKNNALLKTLKKNQLNPNSKILFSEISGKNEFIINLSDILYIKSNDNYISVFYYNNGEIKNIFLRNTLKNIEPKLLGFKIVRCHRSYMVNLLNIVSKKRTKTGFELCIGNYNRKIPVSKTYVSEFKKIILHPELILNF